MIYLHKLTGAGDVLLLYIVWWHKARCKLMLFGDSSERLTVGVGLGHF